MSKQPRYTDYANRTARYDRQLATAGWCFIAVSLALATFLIIKIGCP
jgi:hypothetical protein